MKYITKYMHKFVLLQVIVSLMIWLKYAQQIIHFLFVISTQLIDILRICNGLCF